MIMAADATKEIQFEIGHVPVIDIVGYSKLSVNETAPGVEQLNQDSLALAHFVFNSRIAPFVHYFITLARFFRIILDQMGNFVSVDFSR
jgi:hypothetical protein